MTGKQIKTCKLLLLKCRQEILAALEVHNNTASGPQEVVAADPLEPVDGSRALELVRVLGDAVWREIMEIDHALGKIAAGGFGICEWPGCAANIAFERLKVLPTARLCITHQEMCEQMARSGQALPTPRFLQWDGVILEEGEEAGWEDLLKRWSYISVESGLEKFQPVHIQLETFWRYVMPDKERTYP